MTWRHGRTVRPAGSDDPLNEATSADARFAEADRQRIAHRDARSAAREADPVAVAVADMRRRAENADALEAINAWYEKTGHPLAGYLRNSDHLLSGYFDDDVVKE